MQVCIVLFQQLHFYDSVSLVQSIKTGEWHEVVRDSRKVEAAGAGWCESLARHCQDGRMLALFGLATHTAMQAGGL